MIEPLPPFLTRESARAIADKFGTPVYVYSQKFLEDQAKIALSMPNAYGLTVRYAMKSCPNPNIAKIFINRGLHLDSSSEFEVLRSMASGIPASKILLTSQQAPKDLNLFKKFILQGGSYTACSLHQIENFGQMFPLHCVSVRVNPGLGSGGTNRTNTGGPASSFGIWYEQLPEAFSLINKYGLIVERIHTHIGSGSDPEVWKRVSQMSLGILERFLDQPYGNYVNILNLGGGFKIARTYDDPHGADMQDVGKHVKAVFKEFAKRTGKRLHLEIEPGTFLAANAGSILAQVIDTKKTPDYNFILIDTGMTEVTRPSLYGAQHPISIIGDSKKEIKAIVSGHCCESGDILTPKRGDSEALDPRDFHEAKIGDFVVIGGAGAYCAGMSTINYNSFPQAPEVLIRKNGKVKLIRKRQTLEQMTQNEIIVI